MNTKTGIQWTSQAEDLLGTATDGAIALQLGCSITSVRLRRIKLGIAEYVSTNHPRGWSDREISLLGTMPDTHLAVLMELTQAAVWWKRNKMKIPRYCDPGCKGPSKQRRLFAAEVTE